MWLSLPLIPPREKEKKRKEKKRVVVFVDKTILITVPNKMGANKEVHEPSGGGIVGNYREMQLASSTEQYAASHEQDNVNLQDGCITDDSFKGRLKAFLWDGGSAYDAWFSCASNQVCMYIMHVSVCMYQYVCTG